MLILKLIIIFLKFFLLQIEKKKQITLDNTVLDDVVSIISLHDVRSLSVAVRYSALLICRSVFVLYDALLTGEGVEDLWREIFSCDSVREERESPGLSRRGEEAWLSANTISCCSCTHTRARG